MMLHPSYKELMGKVNEGAEDGEKIVNSRFSIVAATSKRARQIIASQVAAEEKAARNGEDKPKFDAAKKPLSIAVEEFDNGKVNIVKESTEDYENYVADEDGKF